MDRIWELGLEWVVIWVAALACAGSVAAYLITKVRPKTVQQELTTNELLTKFRDLHYEGELTDEEFRTIKTALASELERELKDNAETG